MVTIVTTRPCPAETGGGMWNVGETHSVSTRYAEILIGRGDAYDPTGVITDIGGGSGGNGIQSNFTLSELTSPSGLTKGALYTPSDTAASDPAPLAWAEKSDSVIWFVKDQGRYRGTMTFASMNALTSLYDGDTVRVTDAQALKLYGSTAIAAITATGTSASATLASIADTSTISVGMECFGAGVAPFSTVLGKTANSVTLSSAVTRSGTFSYGFIAAGTQEASAGVLYQYSAATGWRAMYPYTIARMSASNPATPLVTLTGATSYASNLLPKLPFAAGRFQVGDRFRLRTIWNRATSQTSTSTIILRIFNDTVADANAHRLANFANTANASLKTMGCDAKVRMDGATTMTSFGGSDNGLTSTGADYTSVQKTTDISWTGGMVFASTVDNPTAGDSTSLVEIAIEAVL